MKILVAEDQALVRQGICALVSEISDQIVEVADGELALHTLKQGDIDLALIDIGLPVRTGLDVLHEVRTRSLETKVLMLTGDTQLYSPKQVYAAGADGFLYKTADASHFLDVCHAVLAGEEPVNSNTKEYAGEEVAELRDLLTQREQQVVKLIVEGRSNKAAADLLFISEHTVRKHREHINQKLAIRSPLALARFAIQAGLV